MESAERNKYACNWEEIILVKFYMFQHSFKQILLNMQHMEGKGVQPIVLEFGHYANTFYFSVYICFLDCIVLEWNLHVCFLDCIRYGVMGTQQSMCLLLFF
ncbi:hypothetical protein CHS0354_013895 [Potamilus streckersoni]|uniref:Uncharacterized protein n=1 Tax=Potamilus streckersoni TaxID=2493646 RepID=A0AAE0RWL2_9BIVA|nr:hypothetical protein CHS0354_013895 [Potamilus streckersoni]